MTTTLATIHTAAADLIESVGWTQHMEQDDEGRVCLTGALRRCNPQPGDFYLARAVYRAQGHGENWNDARGRTADEVASYLRSHPVDDDALAQTFGPQWEHVVALVRQAATLTPEQGRVLHAAWDAAGAAAGAAAWHAAWDAARPATWDVAWSAAWDTAKPATWDSAWAAAEDAACALVTRDLIGTSGYTQEHYDTLTRPWASAIGPVHPEDRAS